MSFDHIKRIVFTSAKLNFTKTFLKEIATDGSEKIQSLEEKIKNNPWFNAIISDWGNILEKQNNGILSSDYATVRCSLKRAKKDFDSFKQEVIQKIKNEGIKDQTIESINLTKIILSYENAINKAIYFYNLMDAIGITNASSHSDALPKWSQMSK